jgi:hypothetical protein
VVGQLNKKHNNLEQVTFSLKYELQNKEFQLAKENPD